MYRVPLALGFVLGVLMCVWGALGLVTMIRDGAANGPESMMQTLLIVVLLLGLGTLIVVIVSGFHAVHVSLAKARNYFGAGCRAVWFVGREDHRRVWPACRHDVG
jgi:hypothetical protein